MPDTLTKLPDVRAVVGEAEWKVREDLAACYRLVALFGWDDLVFTHISARVPGPEHHFLINPYGLLFEEITASSLVKIDLHANVVLDTGFPVNPAGFTIHSAVHEVREDAQCVMHLHTPDGTAVATMKEGLLPLNQTAQLILGDLAYHDYEGVALDHDERPRLQADLGDRSTMLLRNHGTLTLGATVAEAFTRMYFLERACQMQVRTLSQGRELYPTADAVIGKNEAIGRMGLTQAANLLIWPALLRKLERTDPGYRQ
ncbi:class II aldolase/adducin family protein [Rhodospirillum centenum]|uniref:Class II aldolase, putative n=1 Tax=Rhodospirillum centenum (strain ATCC 51521 / SW) TaxID=414684 RepID=B6IQE0_RHOCS|nr:class II aldolase/adducin family protein [Rhodospirillum centenum]ACI97676.1 class II aldolase, putative [Rhodospirillum centenum SW]